MISEDRYINKRELLQSIGMTFPIEVKNVLKRLIDGCRSVDLLERDKGVEPLLEGKSDIVHTDYADGHGETTMKKYLAWTCPKCGWFVGELYCGYGKWHIQQETSYCSRCGQKIDWSKPSEEEKRRYETEKAREREEWEKRTGHKLDNMYESRRKKYLNGGGADV